MIVLGTVKMGSIPFVGNAVHAITYPFQGVFNL